MQEVGLFREYTEGDREVPDVERYLNMRRVLDEDPGKLAGPSQGMVGSWVNDMAEEARYRTGRMRAMEGRLRGLERAEDIFTALGNDLAHGKYSL